MTKGYFAHIPKTAGTSIKNALPSECLIKFNREGILDTDADYRTKKYIGPGGNKKHFPVNYKYFHSLISKEEFNKVFKFAFVRNPYDRAVSSFSFSKKLIRDYYTKCTNENKEFVHDSKRHSAFKDVRHIGDLEELYDFEYFLKFIHNAFDDASFMADDAHYVPQIYFTHKVHNDFFIKTLDFIGRFENLEQDYLKVCEFLDVKPKELPHLKKGDRKHYREYYTDKTKMIVTQLYKDDIINFGYRF